MPKKAGAWWVYVLECEGAFLYTGISPDPEKRFEAHKKGKGAAFMRLHPPKRILSLELVGDYGLALRREAQIKGLGKPGKKRYVADPAGLRWPQARAAWIRRTPKKK